MKTVDKILGTIADYIIYIIVAAILIYFVYNYAFPAMRGQYKMYIDYDKSH